MPLHPPAPARCPSTAVACASRTLRSAVDLDSQWQRLFVEHLGGLLPLLTAQPPSWWEGRPWKARFAALVGGAAFPGCVYNRELENKEEDFMLSCCECCPRGAADLLRPVERPVHAALNSAAEVPASCRRCHAGPEQLGQMLILTTLTCLQTMPRWP